MKQNKITFSHQNWFHMIKYYLIFTLLSTTLQAMPYFEYANPPIVQSDSNVKSREFYVWGRECYLQKDWAGASERLCYIEKHFPKSKYLQESFFYIGMSQFNLEEYAHANLYLGKYLKGENNPEHFREAIETKFAIAEKYRAGEKDASMTPKNSQNGQEVKWRPSKSMMKSSQQSHATI